MHTFVPDSKDNQPVTFTESEIRSVFLGLMLAILLAALDQTIVSVSLTKLAAELQGVELLGWVVSGYLISAAVATPIFGKLGDLYGRRVTLSSAIGLFLLGSVGCATAQSMQILVAARIMQGMGGGGLMAVALAAIADVVAPRERGRYQVYISTVHAVASMSGPLLGGLLTQYLSWRWIFWLNIPLSALAFLVSRKALARLPVPRIRRPADYTGALLLCAGLTALLFGITRIGKGISLLDSTQITTFSASAVLLVTFFAQERRAAEPIIPLSLLRIPTVLLSCGILFVGFMQLVSLSVLVPMQQQMVFGMQAGGAALQLMPLTLAVPAGAFIAGKLLVHTGRAKPLQVTGTAVVMAGLIGISIAHGHADWRMTALLMATGLGIGLQFPTSLVAIQNAVPAKDVGVATALASFSRSLGGAIGVAVLTAILLATLNGTVPAASFSGSEFMRELVGGGALNITMREQLSTAASLAFRKLFLISAAVALQSFLLSLLLPNVELRDAQTDKR